MWNDLGLLDKARMMELAVKSGIKDLRTIEEVYNYASGGDMDRNNYGPGGGISIIEPRVVAHSVGNALRGLIPKRLARNISESANSYTGLGNITKGLVSSFTNKDDRERLNYLEEEYPDPGYGFLLDDARQKKYMEGLGYHLVNDSNYGMVNKATQNLMNKTGKVRVPIYQFGDDDIDPSLVELVSVDPDVVSKYHVPTERQLNHASYHPKALYEDTEGNHYVKAWDLNDYGQHNGRIGQKFIDFIQGYNSKQPVIGGGATYGNNQFLAELYDFVGNPFVQRTGLVKVEEPPKTEQETLERLLRAIREFKPNKSDGGYLLNPYADGGGIHIKPSHRGRFTELLERTGKSASYFKAHGTPAQKKMATFALNARKWKHEDGGPLEDYSGITTTNHRRYNPDYVSYIDTAFSNAGLSDVKRASLLANIIEESGGNPFALDDTGQFYGLMQWAGDRYSKGTEKDPYKEIDNQVNYILSTLGNTTDKVSWTHGGKGSGYNSYKDAMADFDADDLATAMKGLTLGYVRPTGKLDSYNNRLKVAEQLFNRYNNITPAKQDKSNIFEDLMTRLLPRLKK